MSQDNMAPEELQKLLEIAKTPTKEKIKPISDYSDAYQFILEFKIEKGKEEVQATFIYELYKQWKKTKQVTRTRFFKDFKNYLEKKIKSSGTFYLLNYPAAELEQLVKDKINGEEG